VGRILDRIKDLEHAGYTFEAADASLELLIREETGTTTEFFRLESFRTIVERREDGSMVAEATVKLWVPKEGAAPDDPDGWERRIGTGEGNGPVDALDQAFRVAVNGRYPHLADMHLADYKVRILDSGVAGAELDAPRGGTGATTRVLVSSSDGDREWETVGVSPNIIEASWRAMADAYSYGLLHSDEPAG
jgi:2-isopropylmalate synthase